MKTAKLVLFLGFISIFSIKTFGQETISWNQALNQDPDWYESSEAIRIADNVLVYQHETGGWPKNIDMAQRHSEADKDHIRRQLSAGSMRPTIDNDATFIQMRYLARVYAATGMERFRDGFLHGVDYLLEAQYENGGWPQFYPIRDGYWKRITFNDDAMIGVMRVLRDLENKVGPFDIIDEGRRTKISTALNKGLDVILKTQIEVDGVLTAWCQQYDETDLTPAGARSYEHPSISGGESVGIVRYLMEIEDPDPEIVSAIEHAVAWFDQVKIANTRVAVTETDGQRDRVVVRDPDSEPIWARFYEIGTNRPIFSGRDGVIKYNLSEIERERRTGYSWYGSWPRSLLEHEYLAWREKLAAN